MIAYISFNDLVCDIRTNLYKIPKDIIGVVGIMRSGMIPASIIAEYLNIGLCDTETFVEKHKAGYTAEEIFSNKGFRQLKQTKGNKILVVDDTCYRGISMLRSMMSLLSCEGYDFISMCVYKEWTCEIYKPDLWLRDVTDLSKKSDCNQCYYEWNLFAKKGFVHDTIYDLDGVLCVNPPDERNTDVYIDYINNPIPLFIPTETSSVTIVTYRLEKYRKETEEFLKKHIPVFDLYMFQSNSYEERAATESWLYKSEFYKNNERFRLFVESDDWQARMIHQHTGRPVYCVDTNIMYN